MVIPPYREDELNFAKKRLARKLIEYEKKRLVCSGLPINYSDIKGRSAAADADTKILYDLKNAGKYEEMAKIALEYFKNGDERKGEKYLATIYSGDRGLFESVSRKLQQFGVYYPVFGSKESLIRHD